MDILIFIVVILLFILLDRYMKKNMEKEEKKWNYGTCAECNTEWKLKSTDEGYHYTSYIYSCDDCGELVGRIVDNKR